ncbi:MAG: DEAD/DEAH box helicase [Ignavibacteria bacterium]|nr:DEAD/DEAH box helicase [Ignavibacteria bacterium]
MIKKIASKLKKILGGKSKDVKVIPTETAKIKKTSSPKTEVPRVEKQEAPVKPRRKYKKETPEEYRLRHEKRLKKKPLTEKPQHQIPNEKWDESVFVVPPVEGKISFLDLKLSKEILHAVYDLGFQYFTPVQAEVLPKAMNGEDITAQAQTGTGKTAAFLITIFNHIFKNPLKDKPKPGTPRALILAPTRELVLQIEKDALGIGKYIQLSILSILGGMNYIKQQSKLQNEVCDILICTPGRLIDFMKKRIVDLSKIEILIIDEADRMLDMGFIPDVKRIVSSTPPKSKRQTMFFSATLSGDVKRLAESWTKEAHEIIIKPDDVAVESIEQITYITTIDEKSTLLYNLIMQKKLERVLVFVNRKDDAKRLKEKFDIYGISCALLSGDIAQNQRISRLERFREGKIRVLVATDVASRGIHVEGISHVINYNMPQDVEEYVHRIGRTGRAGASGISISFADEDDAHEIQKLEKFLGKKIEFSFPTEELLVQIPEEHKTVEFKRPPQKAFTRKPYRGSNRRK